MLCMDDTLDKENIFMIFDELPVKNSPLQILFLWRQLFLKISLSTSSWQQVSRLYYTSQTTTHADNEQASKVVPVFIHVLDSRAL